MTKESTGEAKGLDRKKRGLVLLALGLVTLIVLGLLVQAIVPDRSVASFCDVFKSEKARLAKFPGDTWPSGVFDQELSDAGEFATSFGKLEKVAPDEIRPDVETLRAIYHKIDEEPASAIGASMSGVGAEDSVKEWVGQHCK